MTNIEKKLKKKISQTGAFTILEMKITKIENAVEKNKNLEIHRLTIPYLYLQNTLRQYLPKKEIKNLDSRYENLISKYWEIKNEK